MENHTQPRSHLEDCVVAAIETGAKLRRPQESIVQTDPVERTIAVEAVEDNVIVREVLRLALKAQSQSRATLDSLVSFARPRARVPLSERNFDEQTIANGNSAA